VSTSLEETNRNLRLVILELDGLDPHLVDRWEMGWFKQKVWGEHYVDFLKHLYPDFMGGFLTGLNVEKFGYDMESLREKREAEVFKNIPLRKTLIIRRKIHIANLGIRNLLIRLKFINYGKAVMPMYLLKRTFLEELKFKGFKVVAIEVPGYNETINEYYHSKINDLIAAPFQKKVELVEEALEDTRERIQKANKYLERDYEVVFLYTPLPDLAFHFAAKPKLKIKLWLREIHFSLYNAVKELLSLAS